MKFIVHREGRRWVLDAETIPEAVTRADFTERHPSWSAVDRTVQLSVAPDVEMTEDTGGAPLFGEAFDLPVVPPCMLSLVPDYKRDELCGKVLVVCAWPIHAGQALRVDVVDQIPLELAVEVAEAAVARHMAASEDKLEYVETYASGKRAGQPRFVARQDKQRRAEILAAHRRNQARELRRGEAAEMLSHTLGVTASERMVVAREAELAPVAVQVALAARLVAAIERAPYDVREPALADARRLLDSLRYRLACAESVRDYGFAVGERAHVRTTEYSRPDGPTNPVTITQVFVHTPYGRSEVEHERSYVDAVGREWRGLVERLEAPS